MWSFYALALMFSLDFICSITKFGSSKVFHTDGNKKAIALALLLSVLYIFWDFLEPLNYGIGLIIFSIISLKVFVNFVRQLNKSTITEKYGYFNFFNCLGYLVLVILYQVLIK